MTGMYYRCADHGGADQVGWPGGNAVVLGYVLVGLLIGGNRRRVMGSSGVEMTKMPELVAFFHTHDAWPPFIAVAVVAEPYVQHHGQGRLIPGRQPAELFLARPSARSPSRLGHRLGKSAASTSSACSRAPVVFSGQHC